MKEEREGDEIGWELPEFLLLFHLKCDIYVHVQCPTELLALPTEFTTCLNVIHDQLQLSCTFDYCYRSFHHYKTILQAC